MDYVGRAGRRHTLYTWGDVSVVASGWQRLTSEKESLSAHEGGGVFPNERSASTLATVMTSWNSNRRPAKALCSQRIAAFSPSEPRQASGYRPLASPRPLGEAAAPLWGRIPIGHLSPLQRGRRLA